jgi:predicted Zn-ribbon and HTH transcriptional regulator
MFLNKEVARSRKSKAGQIVVHSLDGIYKNAASRTAVKFEKELTSGREDIIEKLDAAGNLNQSLERLRDVLVAEPRWSFARAVAESKADLAGAIDAYAKGAIALNKLATVVEMYKAMPSLLRDLMRHAIDQEVDCATCFGVGLVKSRPDSVKLTLRCPSCRGTGHCLQASEHKRSAMSKALEMAQVLPERSPLVQVQQNTQVNNLASQDGLLEKMSKTADEILYRRHAPIVEAEVISHD